MELARPLVQKPPRASSADAWRRRLADATGLAPGAPVAAAALAAMVLGGAVGLTPSLHAQGIVYSAGTGSFETVGDVDGDGVRDFVLDHEVHSGRDGQRLYRIPAMPTSRGIQADFDGDGIDDIVTSAGVVSGRTGGMVPGLPGADAAAGDIDGDGTPDLVRVRGPREAAMLERLSGRTGARIDQLALGPAGNFSSPWFVIGSIEDLNGDAVAETIVGKTGRAASNLVFDGVSGSSRTVQGGAIKGLLVGDVDGDGVSDLAVTSFSAASGWAGTGLLSGRTFGPIVGIGQNLFAVDIAPIGDVDADGTPDVAVSTFTGVGFFSGRTGWQLGPGFAPPRTPCGGRVWVRGLGDVDGDGMGDVAFGGGCSTYTWRSTSPSLTTDDIRLNVSGPTPRAMELDVGSGEAGRPYLFLGTLSGTQPGFTALGQHIPVNYDAYTALGLAFPRSPLLDLGVGLLDGQGKATATLQVPAGLSFLSGLTMHHVAVTFAATGLGTVSNTVPLVFR